MRNFNRFTIGFLLGLIAFASTSARAGAPNDFFSEAIGAGPLDHVTSLVAPIPDVSTGQTGSTQAVLTSPHKTVNYDDITNSFNYGGGIGEPISTGVSSASADRSTGQLHAEAGVTSLINGVSLWGFGCDCTAPGYANAIAAFGDTVTFSGLTPGSNVIHFSVNIEGSLTTIPPYQTVGGKLSGQASLQVLINQPVCFNGGFCPQTTGDVSSATQINWQSQPGSPPMTIDQTFDGSIVIDTASATVPILVILGASGQFGLADDTAVFSFDDLPPGVTFTSASGDFLSRSVPEPSTWILLLAGFGGMGLAGYMRPRKAGAIG